MHKYQQKIWTKQSPRDKMISNRTFGVTPGCIPDPKKGYKRFERWLKRPRKAIELYWRVRGVKTWQDMQGRNHVAAALREVCTKVAKIQHSKKKIAQSKELVL